MTTVMTVPVVAVRRHSTLVTAMGSPSPSDGPLLSTPTPTVWRRRSRGHPYYDDRPAAPTAAAPPCRCTAGGSIRRDRNTPCARVRGTPACAPLRRRGWISIPFTHSRGPPVRPPSWKASSPAFPRPSTHRSDVERAFSSSSLFSNCGLGGGPWTVHASFLPPSNYPLSSPLHDRTSEAFTDPARRTT